MYSHFVFQIIGVLLQQGVNKSASKHWLVSGPNQDSSLIDL